MAEIDWQRRAEAYRELLVQARAKLVTCAADTPLTVTYPTRKRVLTDMINKITIAIEG
jgi:hypothetical protein